MQSRTRAALEVEPLESRLHPTVSIVNATTATFTDIDGDVVTIRVSAGTLNSNLFTTTAKGLGDQLQSINLSGGGFGGVNLSVTAKKAATGDGLVNVGYIHSFGQDLGKVIVQGDLGRIDAGNSNPAAPAVASLSVRTMGRFGVDTQAFGGSLTSNLKGDLGRLFVKGDVVGAEIVVDAGPDAWIRNATIGGSLIGADQEFSGSIRCAGNIGVLRVAHHVQGGSGKNSGQILCDGKLMTASVGGSLIGGAGYYSGMIECKNGMGVIRIGHDVLGSVGFSSGRITSGDNIGTLRIGGSVVGGTDSGSGVFWSDGDIGTLYIGGDLKGGSIAGSDDYLDMTGSVSAAGRIGRVVIGGSIISGTDTSPLGALNRNATIRAGTNIGSLTVKGGLIGNKNPNGDSPIIISALGEATPGELTNVAIGKVMIGGRVENARILAGYDVNLDPDNADAQIGSIVVGGDWIASSAVAGIDSGSDNRFGNANDEKIGGGGITDTAETISKILGIVIRGQIYGTPVAYGGDHFGFVAERIGLLLLGGKIVPLTADVDVVELCLATGDITIREIA